MNKNGFIEVLIPALLVIMAGSIAVSYNYFSKAPDDNPVEEACEEVIRKETGIDVDLTPSTPEKGE